MWAFSNDADIEFSYIMMRLVGKPRLEKKMTIHMEGITFQ